MPEPCLDANRSERQLRVRLDSIPLNSLTQLFFSPSSALHHFSLAEALVHIAIRSIILSDMPPCDKNHPYTYPSSIDFSLKLS